MAAPSRRSEPHTAWEKGLAWAWAHAYPLAAVGLIAVAAAIRIALLRAGWPGTDSDDSTMGLMAKHILQRGEHPIFFYGQAYMGTIEAYLGALAMAALGVSPFALKLGLIVLYAAFMVAMYLLLARAFDRRWAMIGLALLALGSDNMLYHQLEAYGGYLETLFFGALMLLLTYEIVRGAGKSDARPWPRRWLLFGWGLAAGLGLWSDPIVAPFVACTALALALTVWRELRSRRGALAALGLVLGVSPWILYAATSGSPASFLQHAARTSISIATSIAPAPTATALLSSHGLVAPPSPLANAWDHVLGILVIAIPNNTGATTLCPLDPNDAWPPARWTSPHTQGCILFRGIWGTAALALLLAALALEVATFLRMWRALRSATPRPAGRGAGGEDLNPSSANFASSAVSSSASLARAAVRACALAAPLITALLFGLSSVAASSPWNYSRYLISLLIAVPVALATLWDHSTARPITSLIYRITRKPLSPPLPSVSSVNSVVKSPSSLSPIRLVSGAATAILLVTLALGVVGAFRSAPAVAAQAAQQQDLITRLLAQGATRDYSDYWTCLRMIFESDERVICSVLAPDLALAANRYPPYDAIVRAAPTHAYVFALDTAQAKAFPAYATARGWRYTTVTVDGQWVIYTSL